MALKPSPSNINQSQVQFTLHDVSLLDVFNIYINNKLLYNWNDITFKISHQFILFFNKY
jgi:hypothetical protein